MNRLVYQIGIDDGGSPVSLTSPFAVLHGIQLLWFEVGEAWRIYQLAGICSFDGGKCNHNPQEDYCRAENLVLLSVRDPKFLDVYPPSQKP